MAIQFLNFFLLLLIYILLSFDCLNRLWLPWWCSCVTVQAWVGDMEIFVCPYIERTLSVMPVDYKGNIIQMQFTNSAVSHVAEIYAVQRPSDLLDSKSNEIFTLTSRRCQQFRIFFRKEWLSIKAKVHRFFFLTFR